MGAAGHDRLRAARRGRNAAVKLATRIRRSARVARTGLYLWSIYKIPGFIRRCLGRPERDLGTTRDLSKYRSG